MYAVLKLETPEDFQKCIEFIGEKYLGWKGGLEHTLQVCGFGTNYEEEFKFMDYNNIIDVGYDEADDEEYYNWYDFSVLSKDVLDYFLGTYLVWFSEDFDRMGNVSTRLFIKMDAKETASEYIARYHTLMNTKTPIAQSIDNLQFARKSEDPVLIAKAQVSDEEWETFKKANEELQEMGM